MPLTSEDVIWLYRCLLGREPESQVVIAEALERFRTLTAAREAFLRSDEFFGEFAPAPRYRQGPPGRAVVRGQETLALAVIVKDGAATLPTLLRSCVPIIDHAVIFDTGSSDGTPERAREVLSQHGVQHSISVGPFVDFSTARNAALAAVPDEMDWVLMLDADEHLVAEDHQALLDLLGQPYDAWALPRYNFTDAEKDGPATPYPDCQIRLLCNGRGYRFTGAVHERLTGRYAAGRAPLDTSAFGGSRGGPHIHHMGPVILTPAQLAAKHALYERLLSVSPAP